jgi:soluble lytic murein transglycosylase
MAQQLVQSRTAGAYAGVSAYARAHTGEAASAAYLALGHAYLADKRYSEATAALHQAKVQGQSLADYADFLNAQADLQANKLPDAELLLSGYTERYPDSIFVASVRVLEANLLLQQGDPQGAIRKLQEHAAEPIANHADFQFAMAKARQLAGQQDEAAKLYRNVYLGFPLSNEAQQAKSVLASSGMSVPLTVAERQARADALYAANRFADAAEEYSALASDPQAGEALRNQLRVAAAACELKLKRLSREAAERLPDTGDEAGARRLYLLTELARSRDDAQAQRAIIAQMESRFGSSQWLAEALYSGGNMYLLRKDYPNAIQYYGELAKRFPLHSYAPSAHWRAGWLNYRIGQYSEAARLFDEQIAVYAGGKEIPSALYWRGRIYEAQEHKPEMAAAYYRAVSDSFTHFFYAELSRQRLAALNNVTPATVTALSGVQHAAFPELTDDVPEEDPHVVKAKLLANAGLNEYIPAEIAAGDGSEEWGGFAEAQIYASYGETFRAMHVMKRAISFYTSAPISAIPLSYWRILYPQPYWSTIKTEAAKNGLDPYMVAALIRQESEFNPSAVSSANAWGLMQMLPSVGKQMAKAEGIKHFKTSDLLNPEINIRLGTRYLRETLQRFGNQPELAFAAYNAGDERVVDWRAAGNFRDVDEFVESIPFTETRDYVQAIVRNEDIYRQLDSTPAHAGPILPQISQGLGRSVLSAAPIIN